MRRIFVNTEKPARDALSMRLVILDSAFERLIFDESQLGHEHVVKTARAREISHARVDVIVAGEVPGWHPARLRRERASA